MQLAILGAKMEQAINRIQDGVERLGATGELRQRHKRPEFEHLFTLEAIADAFDQILARVGMEPTSPAQRVPPTTATIEVEVDLMAMNKDQLKAIAEEQGLPTSGSKQQLADRIHQARLDRIDAERASQESGNEGENSEEPGEDGSEGTEGGGEETAPQEPEGNSEPVDPEDEESAPEPTEPEGDPEPEDPNAQEPQE